MTARSHYDPEAGRWVAYRDEPRKAWMKPGPPVRVYLHDPTTGVGMVGDPTTCVRFDTRAEAYAAARSRWPRRERGRRIGAQRLPG